jgi:hypothetical protein
MKAGLARVILIAGLTAIPADTNAADIIRAVPAGTKNREIGHWYSVHPDCSSAGLPVIRITGSPAHGAVSLRSGSDFPNFPASNPRYRCNLRRVPSTQILYTPQPGFTGSDYLTTDIIFPDGASRQSNYSITVK